jgi:hypothetical protein
VTVTDPSPAAPLAAELAVMITVNNQLPFGVEWRSFGVVVDADRPAG